MQVIPICSLVYTKFIPNTPYAEGIPKNLELWKKVAQLLLWHILATQKNLTSLNWNELGLWNQNENFQLANNIQTMITQYTIPNLIPGLPYLTNTASLIRPTTIQTAAFIVDISKSTQMFLPQKQKSENKPILSQIDNHSPPPIKY